ncbi:hypothetical protein PGTUg99_004716 [Puccinia graminis f. sp. tritici]|uniref:Gamma tubulin complex component protein N-terminal domain-containing protein n=1 Tax=Puccinia graminis f. sp. tritici TaxID=56615 RepID=A0A5B0M8K3_PUCGR|nr:hypothetical protein PGTUg99_004716 [Puccinia graminis f. sp. tritici]
MLYSWDTFNRPICSQSSLSNPLPFGRIHPSLRGHPIRNPSKPTPTPTSDPHALKPRPEHNSYPKIHGQTDQTTRSLYDLFDSAFANLCLIKNFIKHTHHPYHPHQSLCSGLAVLVDWIRTEIMDCFEHESALHSGLLSISMMVEPLFELLGALANLVQSCQEDQGTRKQEDVVYQHLDLHIHQGSSNLIQAVFSCLLNRVCAALLLCWQTWLGIDLGGQHTLWPDEKDQLYQSLWKIYSIQSDPHLELTGDDLDETNTRTTSSYCVLSKLHSLSHPSSC